MILIWMMIKLPYAPVNISRRRLLVTGLCACGTAHSKAFGSPLALSPKEGQCFFGSADTQADAPVSIRDGVYRQTSGDEKLDRQISEILFRAAHTYSLEHNELPAFRFIPVSVGGDGFANNDVSIDPGTKGLVALNLDLLNLELAESIALIGFEVMVAHEFAHIFQVRNNYISRFKASGYQTKEIELHADYLAGWYFRQQGNVTNEILSLVVDILFDRGDENPDVTLHHGTKTDRLNAIMKGYFAGDSTDVPQGAAANGALYIDEL